jgi:hypothetical protein
MKTQSQTFREYYASMTDADLLKMAANKTSFIEIAQKAMEDELTRRHLAGPEPLHH